MMEVKEKSTSKFNVPIQWREGWWPINLPRRECRVSVMVEIMFLLESSNILCDGIIPHYRRIWNRHRGDSRGEGSNGARPSSRNDLPTIEEDSSPRPFNWSDQYMAKTVMSQILHWVTMAR